MYNVSFKYKIIVIQIPGHRIEAAIRFHSCSIGITCVRLDAVDSPFSTAVKHGKPRSFAVIRGPPWLTRVRRTRPSKELITELCRLTSNGSTTFKQIKFISFGPLKIRTNLPLLRAFLMSHDDKLKLCTKKLGTKILCRKNL